MTLPITITQAELREISELEREISAKQHHLASMRSNLLVMLKEGVPIEEGRFDAELVTKIARPVPWKQELIRLNGQSVADEIKRLYKLHTYYDVRVMEHAIPPLWRSGLGGEHAET